jgi:hypothetical protein
MMPWWLRYLAITIVALVFPPLALVLLLVAGRED